jgi:hypothetical protein
MAKRYLMMVGRTTRQGQQINQGKDNPEYHAARAALPLRAFA